MESPRTGKALDGGGSLVGRSRALQKVRALIQKYAPTDATVLVTGETGTGKEVVAGTIHQNSRRSNGPFLPLNCAALSEHLIESELFGHERGAYTGAAARTIGLMEAANRGTLFLDEIGEMAPHLQAKLLRAFEEKAIRRLGSHHSTAIDIRVVAGTNVDVAVAVEAGTFRKDLYYRLGAIRIHLPPLRERPEDIPLLAAHFLKAFRTEAESPVPSFDAHLLERLMAYHWPGNIRELKNLVGATITPLDTTVRTIAFQHLPEWIQSELTGRGERILGGTERDRILAALQKARWNKKFAAKLLGCSRPTLYKKMKKHGIE